MVFKKNGDMTFTSDIPLKLLTQTKINEDNRSTV